MVRHLWWGFGMSTARPIAMISVVALFLLISAGSVWAQAAKGTEDAGASSAPAEVKEDSKAKAVKTAAEPHKTQAEVKAWSAYTQGKERFDKGDYEKAFELFTEAYDLELRPAYLMDIARTHEALGRMGAAHELYMKVLRNRVAPNGLREEADKEATRLEPLTRVAILRFKKMKKGYSVQIDGELQTDLTEDKHLEPGLHESCVLASEGKVLYCWQRTFEAGVRILWPPRNERKQALSSFWEGMDQSTELYLNGKLLLVNFDLLSKMVLQEGSYVFEAKEQDGTVTRATLKVEPGTVLRVDDLLGSARAEAARDEAARAEAERLEAARIARAKERDPGPWPWVVTGVGGALFLGGGTLWMLSSSTRGSGSTQAERRDSWESANSQQSLGMALTGAGLAVAGAGLGWWWLTREDEAPGEAAGLEVGFGFSDFRTVQLGGRF